MTLKALMAGLADMGGQPAAGYGPPIVSNWVCAVKWADLQPSGQNGAIVTTAPTVPYDNGLTADGPGMQSVIDAARAVGAKVKLRILTGWFAPAWAKNLSYTDRAAVTAGNRPVSSADGIGGDTCGPFWQAWDQSAPHAGFQGAWFDLMANLAAIYDNDPVVAEVTATCCCSGNSAEPYVREVNPGASGNPTQFMANLWAAGLDGPTDRAAIFASYQATIAAWANTRVSTALAPLHIISPASNMLPGTAASLTDTTGWTPTGCTLAVGVQGGVQALAMTPTGAGGFSSESAEFAVLPAQQYTAVAEFQVDAAATSRNMSVQLNWKDANHALISVSASHSGLQDQIGAWTILPTAVTSAVWAAGTATLTITNLRPVVGQAVTLAGFTAAGWNGTWTVTAQSGGTVELAMAANPGAASVLGTASAALWASQANSPPNAAYATVTVAATASTTGKKHYLGTPGVRINGHIGADDSTLDWSTDNIVAAAHGTAGRAAWPGQFLLGQNSANAPLSTASGKGNIYALGLDYAQTVTSAALNTTPATNCASGAGATITLSGAPQTVPIQATGPASPTGGIALFLNGNAWQILTYTGVDAVAGTLLGCTGTGTLQNGTNLTFRATTIAADANLPTDTLTLASNAGVLAHPNASPVLPGAAIVVHGSTVQEIAFTGVGAGGTLNGCSGGTGAVSAGDWVAFTGSLVAILGQVWTAQGYAIPRYVEVHPPFDLASNGGNQPSAYPSELGPFAAQTVGKVKAWTGSAWAEKPTKAWDGQGWVPRLVFVRGANGWSLSK
ncbi:MAG: hypothetical protein ACRDXE_01575 [Acidimicrobiales bacterium]